MKTIATAPDRTEYTSENGIARWWIKDGAWHIATPDPNRDNRLFWTDDDYATREQAIRAIERNKAPQRDALEELEDANVASQTEKKRAR